MTGAPVSSLVGHHDDDVVQVGSVPVRLLHTPGHTPGSQCFIVGDNLVSGDTLFLEGCGRTDLPGADPGDMYTSLQRLASLPGRDAAISLDIAASDLYNAETQLYTFGASSAGLAGRAGGGGPARRRPARRRRTGRPAGARRGRTSCLAGAGRPPAPLPSG